MRIQPTLIPGAGFGSARPEGGSPTGERLQEACQELEGLFISQMLQSMRRSVPTSSLFGNSSQEKTFRELLDTELSRGMAAAGGLGLGNQMYERMVGTLPVETPRAGPASGREDRHENR